MYFNEFGFLRDSSLKINLHVWFYFIVSLNNTLYQFRDWSHGVERFALSECILFTYGMKRSSFTVYSQIEIRKTLS